MPTPNEQMIKNENIGIMQPEKHDSQFVIDNSSWIPDNAKVDYHNQRLLQSKWAFWLSFGGAIAGFLVIIICAFFCLSNNDTSWIGIISGGIIEAVSALFFTLSNKANEKISEFFDKLTLDSNTTHAMHMTKEISDNRIRDQLLVKLSLHLAGINEDKICKNTSEICNQISHDTDNK